MPVTIGGSGPITGVTSINTSVSDTELGYLDGVTSALQTQINAKATETAWTTWTPTWSNLTVGNGTLLAYYTKLGSTVHLVVDFALGSTSSMGTDPTFTLPVTSATAQYRTSATPIGVAHLRDTGVQSYTGLVFWVSSTTALFNRSAVSGSNVIISSVSSTAPFTWGTGDYITLTATYQAA